MADLGRTTRPKARKRYTCEDCGCAIEPGTVYVRNSALVDGIFQAWTFCVDCTDMSRDLYHVKAPDGHWPIYFTEGPDGEEGWPYLPEFEEWDEVRAISPEWAARADAYLARRQSADPWFAREES